MCADGEPGFSASSVEAGRSGAERARGGRPEEAGGPSAETAPPGGGGETQVPQRGGAHHPAAPVSNRKCLSIDPSFSIGLSPL